VDKVVVQPYLLLIEARSESFEKAELATKEAPTDVLE
jgi:hypothetical protein